MRENYFFETKLHFKLLKHCLKNIATLLLIFKLLYLFINWILKIKIIYKYIVGTRFLYDPLTFLGSHSKGPSQYDL